MNFLRRGSSATSAPAPSDGETDAAEEQEVVSVGGQRGQSTGKGRPTRSRREAEGRRRGPVAPAPKTQREAMKRAKTLRGDKKQRREAAAERRQRMAAGDDRVLPVRDRGAVKAFVRDLVDSRRHLMGLFMPLAVLIFVTVVVPIKGIQNIGSLLCLCMLAAMVVEGTLLGRQILARVRAKFPNEEVKGFSVGWYAFTRATQIRKLRMPAPRVTVGEPVS
ncbi:DUF3043 domain-containing protein [Actinomycetospora endophytica]|uniref:DUF3043 domain-containing protein n=1 Tax=Actinomycetospora endophytica TaxID=2291215 RepID=A0ABS8PE27_9PSEU|nr:DUF3043 domain-containing protein [Actinomycetospora endophytica]MCD2196516.1 DUF3043 domain-containing protein [Actinomycetospora endophytica]